MSSLPYKRNTIRLLMASLLINGQPIPMAGADIIADPGAPRQQQAIVLETANGLPMVNIQTPSAAGVSHNTYQQFDVARPGAILNNSTQSVATQLGGWVQANPHLATGSARLILNEVNSSHPSQLHGFVEIAGSQAELVIANPAGIQCNGCGFINASQVSLSTGRPVMQGGDLAAYRVGGGNVSILGAGMDASQVNYTQIIARAVDINAGLWAQHLQVSTGLNQVGRSGEIQQRDIVSPTSPAPQFALDVAALGGMYARKIFLIGTEAGVGVRNNGHIGASAGELMLMSDGRLINTGSLRSQGAMNLNSRAGINNSGSLLSQGNVQLSTAADIQHSGSLLAQGEVKLLASADNSQIALTSQALTAAGVDMASSSTLNLRDAGSLSLNASHINAHGQQLSGGEQSYQAQQIDLTGSQINAKQLSLTATAGDINLSASTLAIRNRLSASTGQGLDTSDAVITAQTLNLKAAKLNNTAGIQAKYPQVSDEDALRFALDDSLYQAFKAGQPQSPLLEGQP
ncbi:MAG: filamentous hemagglutinin N-terminal domain-containing protein, partial [Methylobacillus glycogenes]|nr:filamentous hemagglutinin N-terminal domain-containing protein [Methylobacillus glycogenes]